ncbi:MAG: asparagine synthase (glutamine-hydrolyzing) [Caldilineaceae bacterium]|nr:asparagine synthase (glutamine-hydrolyzing) [Caldilineaceae bacterium]
MCGIAGQLLYAGTTPDLAALRAMGSAMRYRGPDDHGIFHAPHIGLVHQRLTIRDLSQAGHCPMGSADGALQIVFNGEIYNWRELRSELAEAGYSFSSESDTEVVLCGYREWGEEVVARLRGMFAIAIWDSPQRRLLLARDRLGEKPLFYRPTAAGIDFASTIEALHSLSVELTIDPDAMACYLAHSFIPATHTIWSDVKVLPPAHLLAVSPEGRVRVVRYWNLPARPPSRTSYRQAVQTIERTIGDSVERCLDADVPVGVFLSGGVDSSLVAAMAARHVPRIPAFSLGFREQDFSEVPYARMVAEHAGLSHHVVEVDVHDVMECMPHLVVQYGQPFGDASAIPSHLLARFARQQVKVCLSGDGGDESFGGYWRIQAGVYADRYSKVIPGFLRRYLIPSMAKGLGSAGRRWAAMNELSISTPGSGYTNAESWYVQLADVAGPRLQVGLAHDVVGCRTGRAEVCSEASVVQRLLAGDFQVQLPDDYLTKVDVASMAASLEVRAPFLDCKVIEEAWVLPDHMKLHWGQRKWLLKRIAARWVPREVIYRNKMGFAMPLVHWWRAELGQWLQLLMEDSVAVDQGWIRREPVLDMLRAHRDGRNHHTRLWLVLWLELWFRLVFQRIDPRLVPRVGTDG